MDRGGVGDKRGSKEMDRCPLTMTTICNCWQKAVILPDFGSHATHPSIPVSSLLLDPSTGAQPADPIDNAKKQVHTALNDLISTRALQACN
jgi:hypothetical protein